MLEVTKNDGTFTIEEIDLTMWGDTREWYTHIGEDFESMRGRNLLRQRYVPRRLVGRGDNTHSTYRQPYAFPYLRRAGRLRGRGARRGQDLEQLCTA